jgi:phosphoribosylanthranilate isomerase
MLRVKICGIMTPGQGKEIARLGANAIGFICVEKSPRYVTPEQIREIAMVLPQETHRIGVFMNHKLETIVSTVETSGLTSVQLHGSESVEFCKQVRSALPATELIKAFRVESAETLKSTQDYTPVVDWLLLDAYHPTLGGGTGLVLDWETLSAFKPDRPWFLAGGLTPENLAAALDSLSPQGIDLSSGVEISPGDKDLAKVAALFEAIAPVSATHTYG